jgi:hypothetical protein
MRSVDVLDALRLAAPVSGCHSAGGIILTMNTRNQTLRRGFEAVTIMTSRETKRMQAILDDAVHVCLAYADATPPLARHLVEDTRAWFASDDRRWPVSFLNVCDHLGLDPAVTRIQLSNRLAEEGRQLSLLGRRAA